MAQREINPVHLAELSSADYTKPKPILSQPLISDLEKGDQVSEGYIQELAKITSAEAAAEAANAANKDLRDDVRRDRAAAITREYAEKKAPLQRFINETAENAAAAAPWFSRQMALARAPFDPDPTKNAQQRIRWMTQCQNASEPMLVIIAMQAAATKDLPLAAVLNDELQRRDSDELSREGRSEISRLIDSVPDGTQEVQAVLKRLAKRPAEALIASGKATGLDRIKLGLANLRK